ncbi:MAG: hypothetical protein V1758_10500 [Pseudomonadota bacterium]
MDAGRVRALGTRIRMTKGYRGIEGVITEKTNSKFEFYIIALDNCINLVAGPSAFEIIEPMDGNSQGQ